MNVMERYVVFKGKPFSLVTAVKETGLPREEAIRELSAMEAKGRLRMVKGGYVPLKELPVYKKVQYDFRFKANEIKSALVVLREWRSAKELARELRCSYEKSRRLIRTLHYMKYVERSDRGRGSVYRKVRDYSGERIPWFWGEVAGKR